MAAAMSSKLDVLSKSTSSSSSSGSGCRRRSFLRLLKASDWAFESSASCVSELCKPCNTLAMSAKLFFSSILTTLVLESVFPRCQLSYFSSRLFLLPNSVTEASTKGILQNVIQQKFLLPTDTRSDKH